MLLGRPTERYGFLKQSYLHAQVAARPNLIQLKAQLRDIDSEFQKTNSAIIRTGAANCADAESAWS